MFEEQILEQAVEETLETTVETVVEEASVEAPSAPAETVAEIKDYLNPELFHDIRIVGQSEINAHNSDVEVSPELEKLYFIDADGNYQKCHKLLPDIRRILGEIEYLNGEPVEIIPSETKV